MRRAMLLFIFVLLSIAATAQTQINPVTQVNWTAITGTTAPTQYCPTSTTGSTVNGSTSITVASTTGILVNQVVAGSGIPTGATAVGLSSATRTVTLSTAATATASGVSLTFSSYGMPYTNTATGTSYTCSAAGWSAGGYPGVASDGANGINVTGTVVAGNGVAGMISAKPFGILPLTGWTSMNCFGDSRTAGGSASTVAKRYCNQIAALTGTSGALNNLAVSGTYVADAVNQVFNNVNTPDSSSVLNLWAVGVNDALEGGIGVYEPIFNSLWESGVSWLGIGASSKYTGSSFGSLPTNWTLDHTYSAVTGIQTTTNGATASFPYTVTDQTQNPVLWYGCINGDAGQFTYFDTGFSIQPALTLTTAPLVPLKTAATPSGQSVCSAVLSIPGRVPGTYAIQIAKTNTAGSVHIYGVGTTPGYAITRTTPFVLAFDIYRLRLDIDGQPVVTLNNDIRNDDTAMIVAGLNIGLVNSQNYLFGTTGGVGTDYPPMVESSRSDCFPGDAAPYLHACDPGQDELVKAAQAPFYTPNPVNAQNVYGPLAGPTIVQPDPLGYILSGGDFDGLGVNRLSGPNFISGPVAFGGLAYADQAETIPFTWPTAPGQLAITSQLPGAAQILTGNNISVVGSPVCATQNPTISFTPANANDTLVISYLSSGASAAPTITDNLSHTYTLGASNTYATAMYYKIGSLTGITEIDTTSSGLYAVCVSEYSGVLSVGVSSAGFQSSSYSSTTTQSINSYTVMAGLTSALTTATATTGTIRAQGQYVAAAFTYIVQDHYSATQSNTIAGTLSPTTSVAFTTLELESVPNAIAQTLTLLGSGCSAGTYAKADGTGCGTPAGTFNPAAPGSLGGTTPSPNIAANTYTTINAISFDTSTGTAGTGASAVCATGKTCDASGGTVTLVTGTGATVGEMFRAHVAISYGHYARCVFYPVSPSATFDGLGAQAEDITNASYWGFMFTTSVSSGTTYILNYTCN